MDRSVGAAGGGQLARVADRLAYARSLLVRAADRLALPVVGATTLLVLGVVFYYPVWTVFVEAFGNAATPVREVLESEFYMGAAHGLFADPIRVPGDVFAWLASVRLHVGWTGLLPDIWVSYPAVRKGLFGFTAYQAALSTVASVLLGLPGAYLLARYEFRGRGLVRSLTIVPFVLPSIMVVVGFVATFGTNGTLNDVLTWLGVGRVEWLYTLKVVILAHAFYNAPLVTRMVTSAWENVDASAVETARSLGAGPFRAFRDVVWPQVYPAVLMSAALTFVFTFGTFPIVLALGGFQLATVEVFIYSRIQNLAYAEAAALAVIETAISIGLTYWYLRYEGRNRGSGKGARPQPRRSLWPETWTPREVGTRAGIVAYGVVVLAVFVGPIASMVIASLTGPGGGLTLDHYLFLLERQQTGASYQVRPLPAITNSLRFGLGTLLVAVPMGVAVAVLTTRDFSGRAAVDALAMAPLAVSGIVVGLGLLRGLVFGTEVVGTRIQVTGALAVVAAHAVGAYPFVTRNVAPLLGNLDPRLVESARSLGATRVRALVDIELPLVAAGVVAGAAFAFAISIGEFDSTVVLAEGSTSYTMPVAVERYLGRRLGPATAMGCLLLAVTSLSFVIIERFGGRYGGRGGF